MRKPNLIILTCIELPKTLIRFGTIYACLLAEDCSPTCAQILLVFSSTLRESNREQQWPTQLLCPSGFLFLHKEIGSLNAPNYLSSKLAGTFSSTAIYKCSPVIFNNIFNFFCQFLSGVNKKPFTCAKQHI